MRLKDKVALITGSAGGMGQAAAELFAREGACVIVTDIAADAGEQTARQIRKDGGQAIFIKADVANEEDVRRLVAGSIDAFGRIDVLYNNAGIMPDNDGGVTELSEATWDRIMDVNLKSAFLCTKHVVPHMIRQGSGGSIINVASFVAFMGCTVPQDAYTASKGACFRSPNPSPFSTARTAFAATLSARDQSRRPCCASCGPARRLASCA
jgi:NAD(P)-dependent dehydrogenase (short-subunit alcohol dehydrogenase family)